MLPRPVATPIIVMTAAKRDVNVSRWVERPGSEGSAEWLNRLQPELSESSQHRNRRGAERGRWWECHHRRALRLPTALLGDRLRGLSCDLFRGFATALLRASLRGLFSGLSSRRRLFLGRCLSHSTFSRYLVRVMP